MKARALNFLSIALSIALSSALCACSSSSANSEIDAGLVDAASVRSDSSQRDAEAQDASALPPNASEYVSQSAPSSVRAGAAFEVRVTMRNTGSATWALNGTRGHLLGSASPGDNFTWGTSRIAMEPGVSVATGQSYTFTRSVTAPAQGGSYTMQWKMLEEAVEWFGAETPLLTITVERARPPAGSTPLQIVTFNRNRYGTPMTAHELITCLRDVASDLNAEGIPGGPFGVLVKQSGHNCEGYSCDIICSGQDQQQRQWDVLIANEDEARPSWSEVDPGGLAIRPCELF